MADSRWKDAPHYMSLWNCKLKQYKIPLHTYQNGQNPEYRQHQMLARMQSNRNSQSLLVGMQNSAAILEEGISYKIKHNLIKWSRNPTPLDLPNEFKTFVTQKLACDFFFHMMFIAASFITAKTWKQARSPSVSEQINKLWSIQSMEYSVLKRSELSSHKNTWRKLNGILQSEGSICEKAIYCLIPTIQHSGKGKTTETKKYQWLPGVGIGRVKWGEQGQ